LIAPAVFLPTAFGTGFFVAGLVSYRRELFGCSLNRLLLWGKVFVAASLATFGGEHLSAARSLMGLVPKWMSARLFIAYFVGVALIAAGLSLVARKCIRWSSLLLAIMFLLFVLLLHWPNVVLHPKLRIAWIVAVREPTFAAGALALFAVQVKESSPRAFARLVLFARLWSAMVLIFFGIENILHPECSPGVPDLMQTANWVPARLALAYITGGVLALLGITMLLNIRAKIAAILAGLVMTFLTAVLYVPNFLLASGVAQRVTAINFVADTLLFAGTMLLIAGGLDEAELKRIRGESGSR
jgi:uncharacterized membrane protein YphA (DoxX/SURF4 family)